MVRGGVNATLSSFRSRSAPRHVVTICFGVCGRLKLATLLGISGRHHAVAVTRRRRGETFLSTPRSRKEFASESWTKFLVL